MNSISSLRALAARDLPQMLDSRRCAAAEIAAIRSPRREDFQGNSQVADKPGFSCGSANVGYGKVATSLISAATLTISHLDRVIALPPIAEFQPFRRSRVTWRVAVA